MLWVGASVKERGGGRTDDGEMNESIVLLMNLNNYNLAIIRSARIELKVITGRWVRVLPVGWPSPGCGSAAPGSPRRSSAASRDTTASVK